MKGIKRMLSVVALIWATSASAEVIYTNESGAEQTLTIVKQVNYSYYGFDNWSYSETFTVTAAPNETVYISDYITTWGDGANYSEVYTLTRVD